MYIEWKKFSRTFMKLTTGDVTIIQNIVVVVEVEVPYNIILIHIFPCYKILLKIIILKSVVDLGCGDFVCGKLIYDVLNVKYVGYDTYKKVVEHNRNNNPAPKYSFVHLDFCNEKENIISADMCILKDVLQHWSLANIYTFLDYLVESKKFKYILICNCSCQTSDDTDITNGYFRPLNHEYLPLKKYNARKIYNYDTKEVSIIELN